MSTKLRLLERRQVWNSIYDSKIAEAECYYCLGTPNIIRIDEYQIGHIEAKSRCGSEHLSNKLPICQSCNSSLDNGVKFMDLERYRFPADANHPHNPSKKYINPIREYTPMSENIKLIITNSIFISDIPEDLQNTQNLYPDVPVPYSIAKYISDYKFPSWEYMYKKYRSYGKIIIEPIGDIDINILGQKDHPLKQKEFEITTQEIQDEKSDLEVMDKYDLILKYTHKTRGELTDDNIQYIIDYLWDLWLQEHQKYGTKNNVTFSGSGKNRTVEYRNKAK